MAITREQAHIIAETLPAVKRLYYSLKHLQQIAPNAEATDYLDRLLRLYHSLEKDAGLSCDHWEGH